MDHFSIDISKVALLGDFLDLFGNEPAGGPGGGGGRTTKGKGTQGGQKKRGRGFPTIRTSNKKASGNLSRPRGGRKPPDRRPVPKGMIRRGGRLVKAVDRQGRPRL